MKKIIRVHVTNHLATKVSKLKSKQVKFRGVASAKLDEEEQNGKGPKNGGAHTPDRSVFTGVYPNWREIFEEK